MGNSQPDNGQGKPDRRRVQVLVVDDDADFADMVVDVLNEKHHLVAKARYGGETALDAVAAHEYDAVLLDIKMPDVMGTEVLRLIREGASKGDPAVIMVTADDGYAVESLNGGADGYVVKPLQFDELEAMIREKTLARRAAQDNCAAHARLYRVERALLSANKSLAEATERADEIINAGLANGKVLDDYLEEKGNARTV